MSEISTDYDFASTSCSDKSSRGWETIGCMTFAAHAFIAFTAFVPALAKKKRIYSVGPICNLGPSLPTPAQKHEEPQTPQEVREDPRYACNTNDRKIIIELVTQVAEASPWDLIWRGLELQRLGNRIQHVHPLAFLEAAPKEKMRTILTCGNPLKTKPIMDNISINLNRESISGSLLPRIEHFARKTGKDEAEIRQLILAHDWANFVHYLFDVPV